MRFLACCAIRGALLTIVVSVASEATAQCSYGWITPGLPQMQLCSGENPDQVRFTTQNFSMQSEVQCRDNGYYGQLFESEQQPATAVGECGRALANETPECYGDIGPYQEMGPMGSTYDWRVVIQSAYWDGANCQLARIIHE